MSNEVQRYRSIISPGYIAVSDEPALLCSVCGHGVIVVIWDRIHQAGGIAHCIYPRTGWGKKSTNYHADVAIPSLLRQLTHSNPSLNGCEAQLFGGGSQHGRAVQRRADKIIRVVKKILRKHNIPVVSEDVRGSTGRKIVFDTYSGDVFVLKTKKIRKTDWTPQQLIEGSGRK